MRPSLPVRAALKAQKQANQPAPVHVNIKAGTYTLDQPWTISSEDSGLSGYAASWQAVSRACDAGGS